MCSYRWADGAPLALLTRALTFGDRTLERVGRHERDKVSSGSPDPTGGGSKRAGERRHLPRPRPAGSGKERNTKEESELRSAVRHEGSSHSDARAITRWLDSEMACAAISVLF